MPASPAAVTPLSKTLFDENDTLVKTYQKGSCDMKENPYYLYPIICTCCTQDSSMSNAACWAELGSHSSYTCTAGDSAYAMTQQCPTAYGCALAALQQSDYISTSKIWHSMMGVALCVNVRCPKFSSNAVMRLKSKRFCHSWTTRADIWSSKVESVELKLLHQSKVNWMRDCQFKQKPSCL